MAQTANFTFTRGQSIKVIITLERLSNDNIDYNVNTNPYVPVNLTDCDAVMMWRKDVDSEVIVLEASNVTPNTKIVIDDPTSGKLNLILAPADTEDLYIRGDSIEYGYDLEITDGAGDKTYPLKGTITLEKDYTR